MHNRDMIRIPFGLHQLDPRYWDRAEIFDDRRFFVLKQSLESEKETHINKQGKLYSIDYIHIHLRIMEVSIYKGQKLS